MGRDISERIKAHQVPIPRPTALSFGTKGLWNPVGSADLPLWNFRVPSEVLLVPVCIFLSSEVPFFFVKSSEQGFCMVQGSRLSFGMCSK